MFPQQLESVLVLAPFNSLQLIKAQSNCDREITLANILAGVQLLVPITAHKYHIFYSIFPFLLVLKSKFCPLILNYDNFTEFFVSSFSQCSLDLYMYLIVSICPRRHRISIVPHCTDRFFFS